jgi:hypothetical protein
VVEGGGGAFELYGGATERGAAYKANYLLKWQAIADARRNGCRLYDLNGRLTAGIDQFKGGFGGAETDYVGTYDLPLRRMDYAAWRALWPLAKPSAASCCATTAAPPAHNQAIHLTAIAAQAATQETPEFILGSTSCWAKRWASARPRRRRSGFKPAARPNMTYTTP